MFGFDDMMDKVADAVQAYVDTLKETLPEDLGLDRRSAYRLFTDAQTIAVPKYDDRNLQYYGGFEYVDKDYRVEIAGWVFYSANDDRVYGCLERLNDSSDGQPTESEEWADFDPDC